MSMASVPRYEKLMQLLRDKMKSGQFQVGDRFFSQNELMKKYSLSFATVTRALNELEREGLLRRQQGKGTFVQCLPGSSQHLQMQNQTLKIAVLLPWDARNPAHINFQRLYQGLEHARPDGCQLKMIPYPSDPTDLEALLFSRERLDGAIFIYPNTEHLPCVERMHSALPVTVVGRCLSYQDAGCVYTDNRQAAAEAVEFLIHHGHRSIGMISGALTMTDSEDRLQGYREALERSSLRFQPGLVRYTDPVELNGYAAALDLMESTSGPEITAIFAAGDVIAMGALAAARSLGRNCPDQLSIIGFDDIEAAASLDPPLTTVHVPLEELANQGMQMILNQVQGRRAEQVMLPGHVVQRLSVRRAPAPSTA